MPEKISFSEFASKIKTKYPQYESLDDAVLVRKMIDKYPQYASSVDTTGLTSQESKPEVPEMKPNSESVSVAQAEKNEIPSSSKFRSTIEDEPIVSNTKDQEKIVDIPEIVEEKKEPGLWDKISSLKDEYLKRTKSFNTQNTIEDKESLSTAQSAPLEDIPIIAPVKGGGAPVPDYSGRLDSNTAEIFSDTVKGKSYKLGAKGTGNASMYGKTQITEADCSGAVVSVVNKKFNLGLDANITSAAKLRTLAKTNNIPEDQAVDGDVVLFKTNGKNIDHTGVIVVDKNGSKYIADMSSSFNRGIITPFNKRIEGITTDNPELEYEIISLDPNRKATASEQETDKARGIVSDVVKKATGEAVKEEFNEGGLLSPQNPLSPQIAQFKARFKELSGNEAAQDVELIKASMDTGISPERLKAIAQFDSFSQAGNSGAFEFQMRSLDNTIVGSAARYLTKMFYRNSGFAADAEIMRSIEEDRAPDMGKPKTSILQEVIRDKQENNIWLSKYDPNVAEDVTAFSLGVWMDLPVFGGFGKAGLATTKLLTGGAKKITQEFVKSGVKKEAAEKLLQSSIVKIGAELTERAGAGAAALGGHAAVMDVIGQLTEGKTIDEVDFKQTASSGGQSALLGASVALIGGGATLTSRAVTSKIQTPVYRMMADAGIKLAGFEGEVATFLLGGKALSGDETPTTFKDWAKMNIEFGILKKFGVPGLTKDPAREAPQFRADIYKNMKDIEKSITPDELRIAGYETVDQLADAVSNNKVSSLFTDKNVPASLKMKIAWSLDPKNTSNTFDVTDSAERVETTTTDGKSGVSVFDREGNLLQVETFESKQDADRASAGVVEQMRMRQISNYIERQAGEKEKYEYETALRSAGYENGLESLDLEALRKNPMERTPEETAKIDKAYSIIEKVREDAIKEAEKLAKEKEAESKKTKEGEPELKKESTEETKSDLPGGETGTKPLIVEPAVSAKKYESAFTKGLGEADAYLESIEKQLDQFTEGSLGMNMPVVVAKGAVMSARMAVRTAKVASEMVDAAISHVKNTDWYKGLSDADKKMAEDKIRSLLEAGEVQDPIVERKSKEIKSELSVKLEAEGQKLWDEISKTATSVDKENTVELNGKRYLVRVANDKTAPNGKKLTISDLHVRNSKGKPSPVLDKETRDKVESQWNKQREADMEKIQEVYKKEYAALEAKFSAEHDRLLNEFKAERSKENPAIPGESVSGPRIKRLDVENQPEDSYDHAIPFTHSEMAVTSYRDALYESKDFTKAKEKALSDLENTNYYKSLDTETQQAVKAEVGNYLDTITKSVSKKSRMSLPSEDSDMIKISVRKALRDQIRMEIKAALEGAKSAKTAFNDLGKIIKEKFKYASDKEYITGGQYRSIINQMSKATTETKVEKLMEYVDKVFDDAAYRKEIGRTKKLIKEIEKNNTRKGTKFAEWSSVAKSVSRIDAREMTMDELQNFNRLAAKVLQGNTVDIPALNEMYLSYGQFEKNVVRVKKAATVESLWKSIEKLEEIASSTETMEGYLTMQRAIGHAKSRLGELFDQGDISQKELDAYSALLEGKDSAISGKAPSFEEQLMEIKERILDRIDSERDPAGIDKAKIDAFDPDTRDIIYDILSSKRSDIADMHARDIDSYLQFVRNIKEGAFVPESASLYTKIKTTQKVRTFARQAAINYSESKRFQEAVRLRFTNPVHKKMQESAIFKGLTKNSNTEEFNLLRTLRSFSDVSAESYLGNMDATSGYTAAHASIGRAFNRSNAFKKPMEERAIKMVSDFLKFKGSRKEKWEEKRMLGMFMAERRFQANRTAEQSDMSFFDYVYRENAKRIKDESTDASAFEKNMFLYEKMFQAAKDAGATRTTAEGKEIIDMTAFEAHMRTNQRWDRMISQTDQWFKEMEGKVKASTLLNGRSYIGENNYFPLMQQGKSTFMDTQDVRNLVDFNATGIKMQAGSTYAANRVRQQIELDPATVMQAHLGEVTRNYYIFPELKSSVDAIKSASEARAAELFESGGDSHHAKMLGRVFAKSMVSRTAFNLNGRRTTEYSATGKWMDKMLSAKKKVMLSDPVRILPELASNAFRGSISSSVMNDNVRKHNDLYQGFINDIIGDKHFSKMADDLAQVKFVNKGVVAMEKAAIGVVTFADSFVGKRVFATEMNARFKTVSGEALDANRYMADADYREMHKENIEKASLWALRRTEELFNSKNVMSSPELTRFLGGFFKSDSGKFGTKIFDMLQGYNRNEFEHMVRSARRMKYGNAYDRSMAKRDFAAIPLTNFIYMTFRGGVALLTKYAIQNMLLGNDLDEKTQEKMEKVFSFEENAMKFGASASSLAMGGSSNIYALAIKGGMYVVDNAEIIEPEASKKIYEWMQDDLYISGFQEYGSTKNILAGATPASAFVRDAFDVADAASSFLYAVDQAWQGGYVTDEQYLKIANGVNISLMYGVPNPFSGVLQKNFLAPAIKKAVDENKPSRGGGGGSSDFDAGMELLDQMDEFQQQEAVEFNLE